MSSVPLFVTSVWLGVWRRVLRLNTGWSSSRRVLWGVFVVMAAVTVADVGPALACEIKYDGLQQEEVRSTRAHVEAFFVVESGNAATPEEKWRAEYKELSSGEGGEWLSAGGGTTRLASLFIAAGEFDQPVASTILHYLKPDKDYAVRFKVEACGKIAEAEPEFRTSPVSRPELARVVIDGAPYFHAGAVSPSSAVAEAQIESNGSPTEYYFEYSTEPSASWNDFSNYFEYLTKEREWRPVAGNPGIVTVEKDFVIAKATVSGLTPETTYYFRVKAKNGVGESVYTECVGVAGVCRSTTPTDRPIVGQPGVRNITEHSARLYDSSLNPHGLETNWWFEYTTTPDEASSWQRVPEGAGTISRSEAEAAPEGGPYPTVEATLTGLNESTTYYVRLLAESEAGQSENFSDIASFETLGEPIASAFATHGLDQESLRLMGFVNPHSVPTSAEESVAIEGTSPTAGTFTLSFEGETTQALPFDATASEMQRALEELTKIGARDVSVYARSSGTYTFLFTGRLAGKEVALVSGDGSRLTPEKTVAVTMIQQGGEAYAARYWFEYVSDEQFGECEWACALSTKSVEVGFGDVPVLVGEDLPVLNGEESYHYRISAANTLPGGHEVHGVEQVLTVPRTGEAGVAGECANQALRSGPSGNLPDCRAYEQVTPVDKEGSQEIFRYEGLKVPAYALVGEDGNHMMVEAPVNWGAGPAAGQAPYFFFRDPVRGWLMTPGTPQPEAGVYKYLPQVLDRDATMLGLEASFATSPGSGESKEIEFKAGPAGGPYTTAMKVLRKQIGSTPYGWVAGSEDSSKLILRAKENLYEYSNDGLRQVNVDSKGATIGACGASIVKGKEEAGMGGSAHAVSREGSRVFFEAAPAGNCAEKHLYIRVNGGGSEAETVDVGAYRFLAADAQGYTVLLEKPSGANTGLYLYHSISKQSEFLSGSGPAAGSGSASIVSPDLKAVYFESHDRYGAETPNVSREAGVEAFNIYRYDTSEKMLSFVAQVNVAYQLIEQHVTSDGRYFYFVARRVGALPGGASVLGGGVEEEHHRGSYVEPTGQVYRYDSADHTIECISCASAYDPEPKLGATFGTEEGTQGAGYGGMPGLTVASNNGDYAFFQTPAALIPSDVDGEVLPEGIAGLALEYPSSDNSVSGDVYEWRRYGLHGCSHPQGCLALITNGRGGLLNILLGSAEEGHDVFVYSHSQLVSQDKDTAGDIYDVRIEGGFRTAPPPAEECEGDICATPASPANDTTPSSLTLNGTGNVLTPSHKNPQKRHRKRHPKKKKRQHKTKRRRHNRRTGAATHSPQNQSIPYNNSRK